MTMKHSHSYRQMLASLVLIGGGLLCLLFHLTIYHQTQASAFLNQPEFYYNRFVIRDRSGQTIGDVSLIVGSLSYLTAGLAVLLSSLGLLFLCKHIARRNDS